MTKYIAIIDHAASTGKGFSHIDLESKNTLEAMQESESLKTDGVYLVKIAEKSGKAEKREGAKRTLYRETLCNRGGGWNPCTESHGESSSTWERAEYPGFIDYQIIL